MSYLSLSLLGDFQAWNADGAVQPFRTLKERALLSFLLVENGKTHRRDALAELFWPDRPEGIARNNLRQALFGLRQAVGEAYFPVLFSVTGEDVRANLSGKVWLDSAAYQVHFQAAQMHNHQLNAPCQYCMQHLRDAIDLYRGSFLQDLNLDKNQEFQEWLIFQREQFFRLQFQSLELLIRDYEQTGDFAQAAMYAANQLLLDDVKESLYRRLMTLLAKAGRSGAALDWYETCRHKLAGIYNTTLSDETVALAEKIRAGQFETSSDLYASHHNLPDTLTPFLGREMELAQISRLMESPNCRLLTIVGLGGVGKTRLAVRAARMNLRIFPDGVYFVPLETVTRPEQLIEAIAQAIGLSPGSQSQTRSVLLGFLRLKHSLLVLDNFDQIQESRGLLLEILQAAPFVKMLVTSRERLRLQIEFQVELEGLSYPQGEGFMDEAGAYHRPLQAYPALQLFFERAGRVRSGGQLELLLNPRAPRAAELVAERAPDETDQSPDTAVQALFAPSQDREELAAALRICQRLHGLPLGIELAASLARDYTIAQIDQEVQHSIDFLQSSLADLPERQRSLRISFEHSWELLPESEREVLCLLSIFPGSFTAAAAQVVAGAAMPWLMRLEDRSLVRRVAYGRYDLHPLIRQYAAQKLRQFSHRIESQSLQQHAEFFCSFLSARELDLQGRRQAEALVEIDADLENIQAAWDWAVEHRSQDMVQAAAYPLMFFLEARSRWCSAAERFGCAVQALNNWSTLPHARKTLGALNAYLGWFYCRLTRFDQAEVCLVRSLELLADKNMERERAYAHFALGFLYTWMGRYREAWLHLNTSHTLSDQIQDGWGSAWATEVLAEIAFESGQTGLEDKPFLQTLAMFEHIGEQRGISRSLNYLGNIAMASGRMAEARAYYERLLILMEKLGDVWGAAGGYSKLGDLALTGGNLEQALRLHRRSLQMLQKMGDQRRTAIALREVAEVSTLLGKGDEAQAAFQQALEIAARLRSTSLAQNILTGLAAVMLRGSRAESAAVLLALVLAEPPAEQLTANRAAALMESLRDASPLAHNAPEEQPAGARSLWETVDDFLRDGVKL